MDTLQGFSSDGDSNSETGLEAARHLPIYTGLKLGLSDRAESPREQTLPTALPEGHLQEPHENSTQAETDATATSWR